MHSFTQKVLFCSFVLLYASWVFTYVSKKNCSCSKQPAFQKRKKKQKKKMTGVGGGIKNKDIRVESVIQPSIGTKPILVKVIKAVSLIMHIYFLNSLNHQGIKLTNILTQANAHKTTHSKNKSHAETTNVHRHKVKCVT